MLDSNAAVPMFIYGPSNNYDQFKIKIAPACMDKYKNHQHLITDEKYYEPPPANPQKYNLNNDPYDIKKARIREARKHGDKEIEKKKTKAEKSAKKLAKMKCHNCIEKEHPARSFPNLTKGGDDNLDPEPPSMIQ
jgi:hypothetical protein